MRTSIETVSMVQHHQHMFCARLDMSVDDSNGGAALVVSEVRAYTYSIIIIDHVGYCQLATAAGI